jgi:phage-related protein
MPAIPTTHITDAHRMIADAVIELFELSPSVGSGTIRFKNDSDETWLGNLYTGIPLQLEGETFTAQGTPPQPSLQIGNLDVDLSAFKPLIWSGGIDNARILRHRVLLDDLINNRNIKQTSVYRVKRVDGYSASQIKLSLAVFSPTGPTTMPFRSFIPPAFPFVVL